MSKTRTGSLPRARLLVGARALAGAPDTRSAILAIAIADLGSVFVLFGGGYP
jgi:hypothetical protein